MVFKNIIKLWITFFVCTIIGFSASAQDPAFSQFYANPLYLNPAFTGATPGGCPRVNLNFRDQWPGIGRTYITTSASYDQNIDAIGGGLGILISDDRSGAGKLKIQQASVLYSYHLPVNNTIMVNAGFEASFRMLTLDWQNLKFGDMIDPTYGFVGQTQEDIQNYPTTKSYPDFSAGIVTYSEKFFFGRKMFF